MLRSIRLALFVLVAVVISSSAATAGWSSVRDQAMTLREQGQPEKAYNLVVSAKVTRPKDVTDRAFLAGYLALRTLGRSDLAVKHFTDMATSTADLTANKSSQRSAAGYWLGRALKAAGKDADADQMLLAAAAYRDTFYGQMAASALKLTNSSEALAPYRKLYPDMDIFWHDQRVRRELVLAIIRAESSFEQGAISPAGAKGLMQIMDGTALQVGKGAGVDIDLRLVAHNEHYNVAVGSKLVGDLLAKYNGNVLLMAAAYNAGGQKADEWIARFGDPRSGSIEPVDWVELISYAETREYVKRIVSNYVTYLAIMGN